VKKVLDKSSKGKGNTLYVQYTFSVTVAVFKITGNELLHSGYVFLYIQYSKVVFKNQVFMCMRRLPKSLIFSKRMKLPPS
jgi:hypothetical protein